MTGCCKLPMGGVSLWTAATFFRLICPFPEPERYPCGTVAKTNTATTKTINMLVLVLIFPLRIFGSCRFPSQLACRFQAHFEMHEIGQREPGFISVLVREEERNFFELTRIVKPKVDCSALRACRRLSGILCLTDSILRLALCRAGL